MPSVFLKKIMGEYQGSVPKSGADDNHELRSAAIRGGLSPWKCNRYIKKSLRDPTVKFLMEKLEKSGCAIGSNFIQAAKCENLCNGGYASGSGIVVCCNHLDFQDQVQRTIIHELIHAYDECRAANLDWDNCAHHACSEIRASHLSGDCSYKLELLRGFTKFRGHEPECVRRRALESVKANSSCSESAAKDAMDAVWSTCYNDTAPFDRAP